MRPLTTFSIVGRCERTGQLGVAVSTADVAAGRIVTWAKAGVGAVATQSWPSIYLAIDALRYMEEGLSAPEAMGRVLADDPGTAAATADGLDPVDLLEALFILGRDPRMAAIDFVELDPHRDVAEITTRTFGSAILNFLAGLFLRRNDGWHGYDPTPIQD